jgi:hypothetical protein
MVPQRIRKDLIMRKNEKQQAVDALQALLRKHGLKVTLETAEQGQEIGRRILLHLLESGVAR